jgi:hypothetical protein
VHVSPDTALIIPFQPTPLGAFFFTPTLPILVAILLVALLILGTTLRGGSSLHRRRESISAMAARHGLHPWSNDSLPRGLSLEATHFHRPHKITNVYHGIINHLEVVILDIERQELKSRWSRTILAVRTKDRISAPASLESHQAGAWKLIYSPVDFSTDPRLMEVDQLDSLLRNIIH